ncbi:hypothetical protein [Tychonema sp. LEGE 07203]|uniref:hypothetical protein n=1 Tax=Tychonema sp. LEGE 07203 TaxID=1828671 RepID=UPI00187FA90D|nr:hypothetical protein [Tychonema sp. LEGE 07203]MBE9096914.1 hypothetical protein [Tychonema sp. LEGE 07203]
MNRSSARGRRGERDEWVSVGIRQKPESFNFQFPNYQLNAKLSASSRPCRSQYDRPRQLITKKIILEAS